MRVDPSLIVLDARAASQDDAIREVGRLMGKAGLIDPAYVEGMLGRERQASTYLLNGVAIPHGRLVDRDLVKATGVAVLQIPGGVAWDGGHRVRLVVGLAARGSEHLPVLAALARLLHDETIANELAVTRDPQRILDLLELDSSRTDADRSGQPGSPGATVRLQNPAGLHARPANTLAKLARRFAADVRLRLGERSADAKSMPAILALGASGGATLLVEATGVDADEALKAIGDFLATHEEVRSGWVNPPAVSGWRIPDSLRILTGVAGSPGFAVGQLHSLNQEEASGDRRGEPMAQQAMLVSAWQSAEAELDQLAEGLRKTRGHEAEIFDAHRALLGDADTRAAALHLAAQGHGAAWSWQTAVHQKAEALLNLSDARIAARASDWKDVGRRVVALLETGQPASPLWQNIPGPVVLAGEDLLPSEVAAMDPERIVAVCLAGGGQTSHAAIMCRSRGIPMVVALGRKLFDVPVGTTVIVDAHAGRMAVAPSTADLQSARDHAGRLETDRRDAYGARFKPALLRGGGRIFVEANIGEINEADAVVPAGADGVGLVRSEFLFLHRSAAPSEDEQFAAYLKIAHALGGLPLTIRTLDVGGDKQMPYLPLPAEINPFLGLRGIRVSLRGEAMFRTQLRAIYRAAVSGDVRILFPMIAGRGEFRAARQIADEVRRELGARSVPLGIMVEVPSAALTAERFANEVDFFSIGTNDLTQYTVAVDRQHPLLASTADPLEPAVLILVDRVVRAAQATGRPVTVCGALAADPFGGPLLVGLGVTELSVGLPSVSAVKAGLRRYSQEQLRRLAEQSLMCASGQEVRTLCSEVLAS